MKTGRWIILAAFGLALAGCTDRGGVSTPTPSPGSPARSGPAQSGPATPAPNIVFGSGALSASYSHAHPAAADRPIG